ncbi:protein TIC 214-like [Lycium ferocissimum]|uniref:protein TIC 214-like n=1 Tax=Lycium ferocissimum TaxID=112874 RepID=UPI0028169EDF|nr:protein TIC 214-like [Lycium ferocissimum]
MKNKKQKDDFCFLTVWGMETEAPFGSPRRRPSFFEPIFKELEKKTGKLKKTNFITIKVLKGKTKIFRRVSKETKKWLIKSILFLKKIREELSKVSKVILIVLFRFKEISESNETKKEKDSLISNQIINESFSQIESGNWPNSSLIETKMKDLTDRTSTIKNQIERITKEKKKVTPEIDISPNKTNNIKKLESPKNIFQILKRRNTRLIWKFHYFLKLFIQRLYIDLFLSIINIPRINTQLFLESTNKLIDKYISNNEINQEKINNQKKIHFISTIKKSLSNISKKNSHIFFDLSYLSQAYVFYKLSQTQVINLAKFRSVFNITERLFSLRLK